MATVADLSVQEEYMSCNNGLLVTISTEEIRQYFDGFLRNSAQTHLVKKVQLSFFEP